MNLLDSVLITSNAEEYIDNFKKLGIDVFTLKLLGDEDLQILGVKDVKKRLAILQHTANLQIPAEKQMDIVIDKQYIHLILNIMSMQLTRHLAAVSIAINREDIIICNVKLVPATKCLRDCVVSLNKQLREFEEKVITRKENQTNIKDIIIPAVIVALAASVTIFSHKMYNYLIQTKILHF